MKVSLFVAIFDELLVDKDMTNETKTRETAYLMQISLVEKRRLTSRSEIEIGVLK